MAVGTGHVEEWTLTLTAEQHLAPATIRSYQSDLRLFSEYLTDSRYGWVAACQEAFGDFPVPICRQWKTIGHLNDYGGSPEARPLSREELQRFVKGFGFHPLSSFVDHGAAGTGEPLSVLTRPGNAGSHTATDHIAVIKVVLAQLPSHSRSKRAGRLVLIRTDGAGCTHEVLTWMSDQPFSYSVGSPLPHNTSDLLDLIPADVWTPALDAHDEIRDGAWVDELTSLLDMSGWPAGMRVIVRKERPHPSAQLRITDVDRHRVTAFATNTRTGGPATQLPDLELRHRRRARCENRIRISKDTGLMNLPSRIHPESDLVRHRRPGRGDHRVDADARPQRAPSQTLGAKTVASTPVHPAGEHRAHRAADPPPPRDQVLWVDLVNEGVRRLGALTAPR